ncbi:unnamed protein product [Closterium sp. Yama58-4]|nr:unnamed protein product [Closterium sp. Yama58-4]
MPSPIPPSTPRSCSLMPSTATPSPITLSHSVAFCFASLLLSSHAIQSPSGGLDDRVRLGWKLTAIEKRPGGSGFLLSYNTPEGAKQLPARSLLLTVPSYVAADLLKPYSAAAAAALSAFYYPPVAAVTISYPKEAIREDRLVGGELKGFGQLHPRTQGDCHFG